MSSTRKPHTFAEAMAQAKQRRGIREPLELAPIKALNRSQRDPSCNPLTCGGSRGDEAHRRYAEEHGDRNAGLLVATPDGWVCPVPGCGYRQAFGLRPWSSAAEEQGMRIGPVTVDDMRHAAAEVERRESCVPANRMAALDADGVIFIIYRQVNRTVTALCWRSSESEAVTVMEQIRSASSVISDDMTAPLMWIAPLSNNAPRS
jgi:hypothetical protein